MITNHSTDFEIISETQSGDVRLSLASGAFVTARNTQTGHSVGCVIRSQKVDKIALEQFFNANSIFSAKYNEFKIVGEMRWLTVIASVLRSANKMIAKEIPRTEKFDIVFKPTESRVFVEKSTTLQEVQASGKIRVLIVDDSKTIRNLLRKMFASDSQFEVVADCELPSIAEQKIIELKPDVVTLDLHMPEMDGVELLKRVLKKQPTTRFVVVSAVTFEDGPMVFNALEEGAIDYAQKPSFEHFDEQRPAILEKIKLASTAKVVSRRSAAPVTKNKKQIFSDGLVVIGSSTGGTEALKQVLTHLPSTIPPILIVQHIPPLFSKAFAERMNTLCDFEVCEGTDGMEVKPNRVIVAPGGLQMRMEKSTTGYVVRIDDAPPMNRHKPSVDYLFDSVAALNPPRTMGVILTGMGADGAKGLLKLKQNGFFTVAQDEETSVVFGMPKEAIKLGAAAKVVPLHGVANEIITAFSARKAG